MLPRKGPDATECGSVRSQALPCSSVQSGRKFCRLCVIVSRLGRPSHTAWLTRLWHGTLLLGQPSNGRRPVPAVSRRYVGYRATGNFEFLLHLARPATTSFRVVVGPALHVPDSYCDTKMIQSATPAPNARAAGSKCDFGHFASLCTRSHRPVHLAHRR